MDSSNKDEWGSDEDEFKYLTSIELRTPSPKQSERESDRELVIEVVGTPLHHNSLIPIQLSVKKASPVVLKPALKTYSQPRKKIPHPAKSVPTPTPLASRYEFFNEGRNKIIGVINEARGLGIDPREYHPFYLQLNSYITEGQRLNFIGTEKQDVEEVWVEYDDLLYVLEDRDLHLEDYSESAYARFIKSSKTTNTDLTSSENLFLEINSAARRIISNRARNPENDVDDLKARLDFFSECRAMIHPADVLRMNSIWRKFREDCRRKSRSGAGTDFTFTGSEDEVPQNFRCRVLVQDVADDLVWKSKVRKLLLKRKLASVKMEIPSSPPSSPSSPSSYNPASPSYSPPPSKKRKKKTVRQSTRNRCQSRTRSKSKSNSRKKSQVKPKPKRKQAVRLSKEKLAKTKLRQRRLMKFKRSWRKLHWSLRMICRQRRHWEILRIRRSAQVAITLEKVVSSSCRLRTLKNRKKWRKLEEKRMSTKNRNKKKNIQNVPSPYCERMFRNESAVGYHVAVKHPKRNAKYKKLKQEMDRQKSREAWKKFRETGEGPEWMKRRRDFGRTRRKPAVCDQCGKTLCDKSRLKLHITTVHKPDESKSRCPKCNETYTDGVLLWFHFQSKHLNHDVLKLSKIKAEQMGLDFSNPNPTPRTPAKSKPIREYEQMTRILNDAGIEEFRCDVCEKSFDTVEITKRHLNNVHQEEKQWLCPVCGKSFKAKENRDAHVRQIHEGQEYQCDICSRKLQSKGKLWRHKVEVHQMKDLESPEGVTVQICSYCGMNVLRGMKAHVKKVHPEKICEFQDAENQKPKRRSRVTYKHTRQKQERKWKEEGILDAPWIARKVRPRHNCPFCGVSMAGIPTMKDWRLHLDNFCEGDPPKRSSKTGTGTSTKKRTKKTSSESVPLPKWICPVEGCEEKFYAVRVLDSHIMRHSNAYANLEKEKYVKMVDTDEDDFTPTEYHCLVCMKEKKKEVKVASKGEIIIHFVMNHSQLYNQHKGEMEPEVEENVDLLKSGVVKKPHPTAF